MRFSISLIHRYFSVILQKIKLKNTKYGMTEPLIFLKLKKFEKVNAFFEKCYDTLTDDSVSDSMQLKQTADQEISPQEQMSHRKDFDRIKNILHRIN